MIARLFISLPFSVNIPEGEQFNIYEYVEEGYKISIYPLYKSDEHVDSSDHDEMLINGVSVYQANLLRIDFQKDSFNRDKGSECDPPPDFIARIVNSFVLKLRFVTRGSRIKPVDFSMLSWRLRYLNDDESEVKTDKRFIRGRGTISHRFSYTALTKDIWEDIHKLDPSYMPPQWDSLLLDAKSFLPEIGPVIVLASTALEVFISYVLNELARDIPMPNELWDWINKRSFWLKNPDLTEQFDSLLKILLGISLKDDNKELWEAFQNLKNARNSFVHEGIASIGNNPLSEEDAKRLVLKTEEIIKFIKDKLPKELQWPEFKHSIKVEFSKKIFSGKKG